MLEKSSQTEKVSQEDMDQDKGSSGKWFQSYCFLFENKVMNFIIIIECAFILLNKLFVYIYPI